MIINTTDKTRALMLIALLNGLALLHADGQSFTITALKSPATVVFRNDYTTRITVGASTFAGTDIDKDCRDVVFNLEPGEEKRMTGVSFSPVVYFAATPQFDLVWDGEKPWGYSEFIREQGVFPRAWPDGFVYAIRKDIGGEPASSPATVRFNESNATGKTMYPFYDYVNRDHKTLCVYFRNTTRHTLTLYTVSFMQNAFPKDASRVTSCTLNPYEYVRIIDTDDTCYAWFAETGGCNLYWRGSDDDRSYNTWEIGMNGIEYPFGVYENSTELKEGRYVVVPEQRVQLIRIEEGKARHGLYTVKVVNGTGMNIKVDTIFTAYAGDDDDPDFYVMSDGEWFYFTTPEPSFRISARSQDKKWTWGGERVEIPAKGAFGTYTFTYTHGSR